MRFWSRKKHGPIALDVGLDSVKMLQLERIGPTVCVSACGRWKFPRAAADDPAQRRRLAVAAVRDLLGANRFRGRQAVSCLPCEQLNIKNVRLPHMPEAELAEAVQWEARERFDYDSENDQLAWLNAGQVRAGSESKDEVILLMGKQETIEDHVAMLAEMGLAPEHIDAEPVVLFRVFERFLRRRADEQSVSVLADIGRGGTRVVVARGRDIVFIKSIDIGGRRFAQAVAKQLNLDVVEADDLRFRTMKSPGETPAGAPAGEPSSVDWSVHDAVRGEVEALAREIALCLRYCSVTFRGLHPEQIVVTGGESYDPALMKLLREQINIECAVGQPLRGVDVSGVDLGADRRATLSEWTTCTGLAIRGMDFQQNREDENEPHRLSA